MENLTSKQMAMTKLRGCGDGSTSPNNWIALTRDECRAVLAALDGASPEPQARHEVVMTCQACGGAAVGLAQPPSDARYEWLKRNISGVEWRRIGIVYGSTAEIDQLIDEAMSALTKNADPPMSYVPPDSDDYGTPPRPDETSASETIRPAYSNPKGGPEFDAP